MKTNINTRLAPVVICSGENLARAHGMMKAPLKTEPTAIAVKRYPKLDASRCNAFRPTTGISAGMMLMKKENNACRASRILIPGSVAHVSNRRRQGLEKALQRQVGLSPYPFPLENGQEHQEEAHPISTKDEAHSHEGNQESSKERTDDARDIQLESGEGVGRGQLLGRSHLGDSRRARRSAERKPKAEEERTCQDEVRIEQVRCPQNRQTDRDGGVPELNV